LKIDLYTKTILTIIASCLLYLVEKDVSLIDRVQAQSSESVNVNIVGVGGKPFGLLAINQLSPALPVKIVQ
jgi:hypothetical protein